MTASDDWRTNQRLQMYEWYAKARIDVLQKENEWLGRGQLLYVDSFSHTVPLQEAADGDCGHFSVPSYQRPTINHVLNLVCAK
eukprot:CAMPEP_0173453284 /NCGR_PEP_ID=MMETSP1357-20121228/50326_1 /TAXON_ID=77926 /ORGANISM="Hemiselmis rufescens, Strain PCC563" /LENGTH=82 /DNA_ID=CAMNT_0014420233 /DNA_START=6 /DNA_END=254 /DNA_ORIENTATION=-